MQLSVTAFTLYLEPTQVTPPHSRLLTLPINVGMTGNVDKPIASLNTDVKSFKAQAKSFTLVYSFEE